MANYIKKIIKTIAFPYFLIKRKWEYRLMKKKPKAWATKLYRKILKREINWSNPQDLNEKINWLAFYTDTNLWSKYADKYEVRKYVEEVGLAHILLPIYGKWNTAEDIDFENLPSKYILKTNHGCGDSIIINSETSINKKNIIDKINESLNKTYGIESAEIHYSKIKPCVFAEYLLEDTSSLGLIDYKIWCFNSKPYSILVCSERDDNKHQVNLNIYTTTWENISDKYLTEKYKNTTQIKKPKHLEEMLKYASILSKPFEQVRVDLYEIKDKIYFGELTFTSQGGRMDYYTPEYLEVMGKQINLNNSNIIRKE